MMHPGKFGGHACKRVRVAISYEGTVYIQHGRGSGSSSSCGSEGGHVCALLAKLCTRQVQDVVWVTHHNTWGHLRAVHANAIRLRPACLNQHAKLQSVFFGQ